MAETKMETTRRLLAGMGLGAGLMYLFDPERGRRRRALAQGKVDHLEHKGMSFMGKTRRDLRNRFRGVGHAVQQAVSKDRPAEGVLDQRVRSALGRHVSHPSSIGVASSDGTVTLSGPILDREAGPLLRRVRRIPGVKDVRDRLERHESAGNVPGLQGRGQRPGVELDLAQANWSPATRLLVGSAAGALTAWGAWRRDALGAAASLLGLGAVVRSVANKPLGLLAGVADERRAIDVMKTISIDAPLGDVYDIWTHPENFPVFMSHVDEVQALGDDRYRMTVRGPGGSEVSWDAAIIEKKENERVAWESVDGSRVGTRGRVHFSSEGPGTTRMQIHMSYNPPGGALGHLVARAFRDDPKSAMEDDLVRFKSLLEDGKTTAHGRQIRVGDLVQ